jgi:hypothetical protein
MITATTPHVDSVTRSPYIQAEIPIIKEIIRIVMAIKPRAFLIAESGRRIMNRIAARIKQVSSNQGRTWTLTHPAPKKKRTTKARTAMQATREKRHPLMVLSVSMFGILGNHYTALEVVRNVLDS